MNNKEKRLNIKKLQNNIKEVMPSILKEIEVYEDALKKSSLKRKPTVAPQFNLG
ncbi:hypothetical protein [Algoriphagus winogradskyi]|uniref:Uncharacterized protein n=1 Tax=Algoriphagus winogradskyi TaxID=237017 RepID=A0ABY1NY28_9BACT|nr:hypothetical protein [Algoriphagus winogradskyi]SMP19872.1 hypothetical protein SAMN06265367_10343 [Algoriphagus winogradskyi]